MCDYQWLSFAFELSRSVSFCRSFELLVAVAAPLFVVSVLMYDGSDSLAALDCGSAPPPLPPLSSSSARFHFRSSRHAFLRLFMNSGIPRIATHVVIELEKFNRTHVSNLGYDGLINDPNHSF